MIVKDATLVSRDRIILRNWHIKIVLMKTYVENFNRDGNIFITCYFYSNNFTKGMTFFEKSTWSEFVWEVETFLRTEKSSDLSQHTSSD